MNKPKKKPIIIGILGGVGSGKSAVAAEFAKLGCGVVDADKIAHELLDREAVIKKIVASFGEGVLDRWGRIDHSKVADIVFADADKLLVLNGIIHPLVLARVEVLIKKAKRQGRVKAVVLDMPLLMEVGWAKRCDKLIFVECDERIRAERGEKAGLEGGRKYREKFQISLDKKKSIADNTIDNNSGFSALAGQVTDIFFLYNG
ncbi:MAG: dephospho-CoA kinase [Phycisphaerae bacterium]|nr:dephospho-CoA kinase [Phycisphaerae bacterium]